VRAALTLALLGCLSACAPKPPALAPGPTPVERLSAAEALVKAGCFDCLAAALKEFEALRSSPAISSQATLGAARSAALLAIRERDLGTEDSGYLQRAHELAAAVGPSSSLPFLLQVADTLPQRGGVRQMSDDTDLTRNQTALRNRDAWTAELRAHADDDPLTATLWLSYNCAYVPAGQQVIPEWLDRVPAWKDTPLLAFKAAVCRGFQRAPFEALLDADARFKETHYFIGLAFAFGAKIDEAMEHLLRAYEWHPRWPAVTNSLAGDYVALEEFDTAIAFYDRTLAVVPSFADAMLGKVKALTYAGRYMDAITATEPLLAGRWQLGDTRYWRAFNELQLDRLDEAWDDIELAAKLIRNAGVPKLAGLIAYRRKQLDVARAKFEESHALGREDCETGFYLGVVHAEQGTWPAAESVLTETSGCLEKAEQATKREIEEFRAAPDLPAGRRDRQIKKREQQIANGRRMMAQSWFNIAVACYNLSRRDEARQYAEKVASDEQFGERARELLTRLR
jgi:tetratricopeptide (TPR) repeat protein